MIDVRCHSSGLYWKVEQTVGNKSVSNIPLWSLLQFLHLGSCLSFCRDFPQSWSVLWKYKPSNLFLLPGWFAQFFIIATEGKLGHPCLPLHTVGSYLPWPWGPNCCLAVLFQSFLAYFCGLCLHLQFLISFQIALPVLHHANQISSFVPNSSQLFMGSNSHLHSGTCAFEQHSNQLKHRNELLGHLCEVK